MKVLVIEDTQKHQESAIEQLKARGHEVTVASSFAVAELLLSVAGRIDVALDRQTPRRVVYLTRQDHPDFFKGKRDVYANVPRFDVVLTDMNLPTSEGLTGIQPHLVEEGGLVPYGFPLALKAASVGVKYVAMVTDTGHHDSALSAALDMIARPDYDHGNGENTLFSVNESKVVFVHAPMTENGAKDWGRVFDDLVAD